jgi:hypothetical protein
MTSIEALQTGKPFKRPTHTDWIYPKDIRYFQKEDILADDWIVMDIGVNITRKMVEKAWDSTVSGVVCPESSDVSRVFRDFLKALGI